MSGNSYHSSDGFRKLYSLYHENQATVLQEPCGSPPPGNQDAQNQNLTNQIYLSAILKYLSSNVLKLVSNETQSDRRIHEGMLTITRSSITPDKDAKSQVHEMSWDAGRTADT